MRTLKKTGLHRVLDGEKITNLNLDLEAISLLNEVLNTEYEKYNIFGKEMPANPETRKRSDATRVMSLLENQLKIGEMDFTELTDVQSIYAHKKINQEI